MYTKESNNETRDKGHDTCCISSIEPLEKDKRGDNGGTRESDIVHWVYTERKSNVKKKGTQCSILTHWWKMYPKPC